MEVGLKSKVKFQRFSLALLKKCDCSFINHLTREPVLYAYVVSALSERILSVELEERWPKYLGSACRMADLQMQFILNIGVEFSLCRMS